MAFKLDTTTARLFVSVVEEGSIAAAARRENIAASAVSKRISELESYFGTTLLRRHANGVEISATGAIMLRRARNLLHEAGALETELRNSSNIIEGHIRVAAIESALVSFLPDAIQEFLSAHPGVSIDLVERLTPEVVRAVDQQTADLGVFVGETSIQGVSIQPCFRDRIVAVVHRDHPLAGYPGVTLTELLEHEVIGYDPRAGLQLIQRQAALIGRQVRIRVRADGYDVVCRLAQAGLGVGIVGENSALLFAPTMDLVILPLLEPWARREHRICIKESTQQLGQAARLLLEHIRDRDQTC